MIISSFTFGSSSFTFESSSFTFGSSSFTFGSSSFTFGGEWCGIQNHRLLWSNRIANFELIGVLTIHDKMCTQWGQNIIRIYQQSSLKTYPAELILTRENREHLCKLMESATKEWD